MKTEKIAEEWKTTHRTTNYKKGANKKEPGKYRPKVTDNIWRLDDRGRYSEMGQGISDQLTSMGDREWSRECHEIQRNETQEVPGGNVNWEYNSLPLTWFSQRGKQIFSEDAANGAGYVNMNHAVKSNENSSDGGYIKLYPSLDLDEVSCAEKCIELYASIGTNEVTYEPDFDNGVPVYQEITERDLYRGEIRDIIVGGLSLYTASVRNNKEFNPTSSLEDAIGRGSCVTKRWSDMSRVKASSLLQSLDEFSKLVQHSLFNFIITEGSYIKSIDLLVQYFATSPEVERVLSKRNHHLIFSNIVEIQKFSRVLMDMLARMWIYNCHLNPQLVSFGIKHYAIHNSDAYTTYLSNHQCQVKTLKEERSRNKQFSVLVSNIEKSPALLGHSLESFLRLPGIRIAKRPLYLEQALSFIDERSLDYVPVSTCHEELIRIIKACSDVYCSEVGPVRTNAIDEDFRFMNLKPVSVTSGNGGLIKEGYLTCTKRQTPLCVAQREVNLYLIVYRDVMFVSNLQQGYTFEIIAYGNTKHLRIKVVEEKVGFRIEFPDSKIRLEFQCSSRRSGIRVIHDYNCNPVFTPKFPVSDSVTMEDNDSTLVVTSMEMADIPAELLDGPLYQDVPKFTGTREDKSKLSEILNAATNSKRAFNPTESLNVVLDNAAYRKDRWKDMKRVKERGLLWKMDVQSEAVQELLFELIKSESAYLRSLDMLVMLFLASPEISDSISKRNHHLIFGNVSEIRKCSRRFLSMLCQIWRADCKLSASEIAFGITQLALHHSSIFVTYFSNWHSQQTSLHEIRKSNKKFDILMSLTEDLPRMKPHDLSSFLAMPLSRFNDIFGIMANVQTLLDKNSPDAASVQTCMDTLSSVGKPLLILTTFQASAAMSDGPIRTFAIDEDFDFKSLERIPVIYGNGGLIKEGRVKCISRITPLTFMKKSSNCYLIVYQEVVFITNKSLFRNRYEVIAYARRKNTVAKNNTSSVTMTLTMKEAETMYEFQFGCLSEMKEWSAALQTLDACKCQTCT
ncbi:hypothetical protein LSH36_185g00029 [Paralvinella palmiformis]|uniref:DH domain-containing protein n=1 Tax=Paralvinella palmiformis TaxID=53620 RepID=A0AAD9JR88_9ANNE|nr:hypothetical protein LSH36_185g00029 [Paralvinella palmiformis]